MPISRVSLVKLTLLLSLCLQILVAQPVRSFATATVSVQSSDARPNFPESITFMLSAEVVGEIAYVDLVYQQASLETFQLLPAEIKVDGRQVRAEATADLATYFLPAGIDVRYHWVLTMADSRVIETDAKTIIWMDDRFDWALTSVKGTELYSYGRSDDFLEYVGRVCEDSGIALSKLYGLSNFAPIRIWIYESGDDFAGTLAANSQEWVAGSAYPDLQVITAVIPENSRSEVGRVLPHEISHQLLYQATLNPFTVTATWIDEGLAILAQTGGKEQYRDVVADAYEDGELLSLRGLISTFPFEPGEARKAYAQSFLIMEFVVETYGAKAIDAIIDGYRSGLNHDEVLVRALGMDIEGLEAAWLESLAFAVTEQAA